MVSPDGVVALYCTSFAGSPTSWLFTADAPASPT